MPYFTIWNGLRGCYLPDSVYIIRANTRRDLKSALQWEADSIRDAGGIGMNKRAIAWLASAAWKENKKGWKEYVAPYKWKGQDSYPYALGVSPATRREYLTQDND